MTVEDGTTNGKLTFSIYGGFQTRADPESRDSKLPKQACLRLGISDCAALLVV